MKISGCNAYKMHVDLGRNSKRNIKNKWIQTMNVKLKWSFHYQVIFKDSFVFRSLLNPNNSLSFYIVILVVIF